MFIVFEASLGGDDFCILLQKFRFVFFVFVARIKKFWVGEMNKLNLCRIECIFKGFKKAYFCPFLMFLCF
jgi:hypothetical protein